MIENEIRYIIGIDCGKKTGLAIWDTDLNKFDLVKPCKISSCISTINDEYCNRSTHIIVEKPRTKAVWHFGKKGISASKTDTIAVNVGMVIRESEIMVEMLEYLGYSVRTCHPIGKNGNKKDDFKRITGYSGVTNQHTRDAGLIAFKHRHMFK